MADIQFLIKVTGAGVPEAVELIKAVGAQVQAGLQETGHNLQLKMQICCQRCGEVMTMRDKTLVCDPCIADEERERQMTHYEEADLYRLPVPALEPVECEVM